MTVVASNAMGRISRISLAPLRRGVEPWAPPVSDDMWQEWLGRVSDLVDRALEHTVIIPPATPHRRRFAAVLLDATLTPIAFAKWTRNALNPLAVAAETRLTARPPSTFVAPRLLDVDSIEGWSYTVNDPLPQGPHRPATLTAGGRRAIVEEIHAILDDIDGGSDLGHGDFTPWNVRRLMTGDVAVIDWEQVGPAPGATDELWHVITGALAAGRSVDDAVTRTRQDLGHHTRSDVAEAATFLREREIAEPAEVDVDIERSRSLVDFEARISEALTRLQQ